MAPFRLAKILSPLLAILLLTPNPASAQQGNIRPIHDPHIIAADHAYYIFSTGANIPIRRSIDLVQWERIGFVFTETPASAKAHVPDVRGLWAPDISYFNGQYHLYYSASTFGRNRSCIGLAVNQTLDPANPNYRWIDLGLVIKSTPQDNFNAIDANLTLDAQNQPYLAFGSFWSGIKLIRIDPLTGKPPADARMHAIAARPSPGAIEAPFIIRRQNLYYLFVSFDYCGRGVKSTYNIRVGRSKNITGPYLDKADKPMLDGGGSLVLDTHANVRGPGHNSVLTDHDKHYLVHHYYDANFNGTPTLQIRPLTWDTAGWPIAGAPLTASPPTTRPTTQPQ